MGTVLGVAAGAAAIAIVGSLLLREEINAANGAADLLREVDRLIPGGPSGRGGASLPLKLTATVGAGLIVAAFVGGVL